MGEVPVWLTLYVTGALLLVVGIYGIHDGNTHSDSTQFNLWMGKYNDD